MIAIRKLIPLESLKPIDTYLHKIVNFYYICIIIPNKRIIHRSFVAQNDLGNIPLPSDFIFRFKKGYDYFFSCKLTQQLQSEFGDVPGMIFELEKTILKGIELEILNSEVTFLKFICS